MPRFTILALLLITGVVAYLTSLTVANSETAARIILQTGFFAFTACVVLGIVAVIRNFTG